MKYLSGESIAIGDRVTYNGQQGCIALIGQQAESGTPSIQRTKWNMNDSQILIFFDNGARLMLDDVPDDAFLVFCRRKDENSGNQS